MQQKYCDQGRRIEDDPADRPGAQFLRFRRKAEEGVDFALDKQIFRLRDGIGDPANVLLGVEPDLGGHQGQQQVGPVSEPRHPDGLSLKTGNAVHAFVTE